MFRLSHLLLCTCLLGTGLLGIGCGVERRAGDDTSSSCDMPCGSDCCEDGDLCVEDSCQPCERKTCLERGLHCGDADDGCGGTLECGDCPDGLSCGGGGEEGRCGADGCNAETDAELCASGARDCGALTKQDSCGVTRTIDSCGTCTAPATCGGSGRTGTCGEPGQTCVPETDRQMCQRLGRTCGSLDDFDNCDGSRHVNTCGSCTGPETCGGGGRPGVCGCTGETNATLCQQEGAQCGTLQVRDRCDVQRTVDCGGCTSPATCGGGGQANACGCTGETELELCASNGLECGTKTVTDRCGTQRPLSCGNCVSPRTCGGGGQVNRCGCTAQTDAELCTAANARCGSITRTDRCGVSRTATCGACSSPETCGGGGTTGQCGCTSTQTDAALCTAAEVCGMTTTLRDDCGRNRNVTCAACVCVPESDATFCARFGIECGPAPARTSRKDNCGAYRDVANCGTCVGGEQCGRLSNEKTECTPWTEVRPAGAETIAGIWGVSDNEVYALSAGAGTTIPHLAAMRWNGSAWTVGPQLTVPNFQIDKVTGFWATTGAIYATLSGYDTAASRPGGVVLRSDAGATTWSTFTVVLREQGAYNAVHGTSASNVFVGGSEPARIKRFDGTRWTDVPLVAPYASSNYLQINSLWAFGPNDLFYSAYVQREGTASIPYHLGVWRWNGTSATRLPLFYFDSSPVLYGAATDEIWALDGSKAWVWNGTAWAARTPTGMSGQTLRIHGSDRAEPYAIGISGGTSYTGEHVFRRNGTAWEAEAKPSASSSTTLWVGPGRVWVGGYGGLITRRR